MREGIDDVTVSQLPLSLSGPLCFPLILLPLLFPCRVGVVHPHLSSSTQAASQMTDEKEHSQVKK